MRTPIHTRYLLRSLAARLAVGLPALCALTLAFDLGDQGRRLAATLGWSPVLRAALLHLPLMAVQVMPVALLLAAALTLAALRRRGELLAMTVSGLPPGGLWRPLLLCGLLCGGLALALDEGVVPGCERAADRLYQGRRVSSLTGAGVASGWLRLGEVLVLRETPPGGDRILALELAPGFKVRRRLEARLDPRRQRPPAVAAGSLRVWEPGRPAVKADDDALPWLPAAISLWGTARIRPEARGSLELYRGLRLHRAAGQDRTLEWIVLHTKLAYPLVNLLAALLACTLVRPARRGSPAAELLRALGMILGLWFLLATGWLLGRSGWLSPAPAVWLPLLGAALLAGLRLWRTNRVA